MRKISIHQSGQKTKCITNRKKARSKSGKKQGHSIGKHWLNEGSAKGINHAKSRELLHLHYNCVLYLFLRKTSYEKKQQCQTKCQPSLSFILQVNASCGWGTKRNHLKLASTVTKQLQMSKTTRGDQVKVTSGHKLPNHKDLCLLKQSKHYSFLQLL